MTNAQARCLSRPFAPCPQVTFVIHPVRLPNAGAGLQPGKPHAASSTRIAEKTSWYIERIAPAQAKPSKETSVFFVLRAAEMRLICRSSLAATTVCRDQHPQRREILLVELSQEAKPVPCRAPPRRVRTGRAGDASLGSDVSVALPAARQRSCASGSSSSALRMRCSKSSPRNGFSSSTAPGGRSRR